jgi:hypothetical protein
LKVTCLKDKTGLLTLSGFERANPIWETVAQQSDTLTTLKVVLFYFDGFEEVWLDILGCPEALAL